MLEGKRAGGNDEKIGNPLSAWRWIFVKFNGKKMERREGDVCRESCDCRFGNGKLQKI